MWNNRAQILKPIQGSKKVTCQVKRKKWLVIKKSICAKVTCDEKSLL